MSPSQSHSKGEVTTNKHINDSASFCSHNLKINKDSHFIKKSSSTSSSSLVNGEMPADKPRLRQPVIIYTHSPRVIHTNPRDFMALVQKLTGLPRSGYDGGKTQPKQEVLISVKENSENNKNNVVVSNEDNETTSSVITDDNNSGGSVGDCQVNSCFLEPPVLEPRLNSVEFLCSNRQLLNYTGSLFSSDHNMMSYFPSSAAMEMADEDHEVPEY